VEERKGCAVEVNEKGPLQKRRVVGDGKWGWKVGGGGESGTLHGAKIMVERGVGKVITRAGGTPEKPLGKGRGKTQPWGCTMISEEFGKLVGA